LLINSRGSFQITEFLINDDEQIRKRARAELDSFSRQWRRAAASDPEWVDPYKFPEERPAEVIPEQPVIKEEEK
jgi:hypothetical protein